MKKSKVIVLPSQGFCYGVNRAITIVKESIDDNSIKKPLYILGELAHNKNIRNSFDKNKVITLNKSDRLSMLDEIPDYSTVVITAHGVSKKVIEKCNQKKLKIIDCTCPFVKKTYNKIYQKLNDGYSVIFIGKDNHPETEAVKELGNNVYIYSKELPKNISSSKILIAHQTTLSDYDVDNFVKEIKKVYKNAKLSKMICNITQQRQDELKKINDQQFNGENLIIVIGDKLSNNSTKLFELANRINRFDSIMINSIEELNQINVRKYDNIIISSGTSTPIDLINMIIYKLKENIEEY